MDDRGVPQYSSTAPLISAGLVPSRVICSGLHSKPKVDIVLWLAVVSWPAINRNIPVTAISASLSSPAPASRLAMLSSGVRRLRSINWTR